MEHVTVAMISYAPEFLEAMERVDSEVLEEAFGQGVIGQEELEQRRLDFHTAKEAVDWSSGARIERLKNWLALRPDNENVQPRMGYPQMWMAGHRYQKGSGGESGEEDSYDDSTDSYTEEEESENEV